MEHKILTVIALAFLLGNPTNGRPKDPDEDRAYEFGFTIEGMQHRHEKKDVNGIIQGEFGFITADGVYHVTVYATDENGNFRILSMKNIKVSPPLDGSPDFGSMKYSSIPKGSSPPQAPPSKGSLQPVQVQKRTNLPSTKAPNRPFTTQPTLKPACAGCGYVTTSKSTTVALPSVSYNTENRQPFTQSDGFSSPGGLQSSVTQQGAGIPPQSDGPVVTSLAENRPSQRDGTVRGFPKQGQTPLGESLPVPGLTLDSPNLPSYNVQQPYRSEVVSNGQQELGNRFGTPIDGNSVRGSEGIISPYSDSFSNPQNDQNEVLDPAKPVKHSSQITYRNPESPVKVSNGVIKIPGNDDIPIKDKYPGMVDGLPAGINEKDISDILYRFNWTVGFQGHYETGYKNGAKVGGYFVSGSDGYSRVVTYVADEFGYRPKVKLINIGLDSPDTPKDDKTFELKSFEFVWYPVK